MHALRASDAHPSKADAGYCDNRHCRDDDAAGGALYLVVDASVAFGDALFDGIEENVGT